MKEFDKNSNMAMSATLRGTISAVNDSLKMQEVQVESLQDEVLEEVEHFETYGFTSHPLVGAEVITSAVGGDRSHSIALIIADRRYRIKAMEAGEVAIYTDEGDFIHFKRGNVIDIQTKTLNIKADTSNIDSKSISLKGNTTLEGDLSVSGDVKSGNISLQNHIHTGDNGGNTSKPK